MKYDKLFVPTRAKSFPDDYVTGEGAFGWSVSGWDFCRRPLWLIGKLYRYGNAVVDYASMTPEDLSEHRQALEAAEAEAKRKEEEGMEEAYELLAEIYEVANLDHYAQSIRDMKMWNDDVAAVRLIRDKLKEARNND